MEKCTGKCFIRDGQLINSLEFDPKPLRTGTTIYEVIRVIEGKYLFLEEHITRLYQSASVANIQLWKDESDIYQALEKLRKKNNLLFDNVKLVFHLDNDRKLFLVYAITSSYPTQEDYKKGVKVQLLDAERINPNVKIFNPALRALADAFIDKAGIYEALLVNKEGFITEGNRSNVFFIKNNEVFTPPIKHVLPGITRNHVLGICRWLQIPVKEILVNKNDLEDYETIFLTGTSPKVLPVNTVNEFKYATDHPLMHKVMDTYNEEISLYIISK